MRRFSILLSSLLLLAAALGLLYTGRSVLLPATNISGSAPEPLRVSAASVTARALAQTAAPSPHPVPVTVVDEAWNEKEREQTPEEAVPASTPVPIPAGTLELRNETPYEIDFTALPALPRWESENPPTVLILHTHGSEAYAEAASSGCRSQDEALSVLAVGDVMARVLEEAGLRVIHDRTLCDYPEYTGAYNRSRAVGLSALDADPEIFLVLDVHRDAVQDSDGNQMRMACTLEGEDYARLMLVVGTDAGGLDHPHWKTNLSLAAVLQSRLDGGCAGLMRPLNLRTERFNQDLGKMALLVEVGASGNTLDEAKRSAECFAEVLSDVLIACRGKSS